MSVCDLDDPFQRKSLISMCFSTQFLNVCESYLLGITTSLEPGTTTPEGNQMYNDSSGITLKLETDMKFITVIDYMHKNIYPCT